MKQNKTTILVVDAILFLVSAVLYIAKDPTSTVCGIFCGLFLAVAGSSLYVLSIDKIPQIPQDKMIKSHLRNSLVRIPIIVLLFVLFAFVLKINILGLIIGILFGMMSSSLFFAYKLKNIMQR